jgi:ParB-like nuclease family protein
MHGLLRAVSRAKEDVVESRPAVAGATELLRVDLARLHPHPLNSNRMTPSRRKRLQTSIEREGRYPPLVVRSHPELSGEYQVLDGHQRLEAIRRLGHAQAVCFCWECDDQVALRLLATLNRLEGKDDPKLRSALIKQLMACSQDQELAEVLPESASRIHELLARSAAQTTGLLEQVRGVTTLRHSTSFVLTAEDEASVEAALADAAAGRSGPNLRGRALGIIARSYLEAQSNG